MSVGIRAKFLGTILVITLGLSFVFFTIIAPLVNRKFEEHELMSATRKVKQARAVFNYQFQSLGDLVHDLANWHDAHLFVSGQGGNEVGANVMRNAFVNSAKVDVFLGLNGEAELTRAAVFNKENHKMEPIDKELFREIMSHGKLFNRKVQKRCEMCVIEMGGKYLILAASPIHGASNEDGVHGILILGRFLEEQQIKQFKDKSQYSVEFFPISGGPEDVQLAAQALAGSPEPYYVKTLSEEFIRGYSSLHDASGENVLMMVLTIDRLLFKKHHDNLPFLLKTIILCSVFFGIICFFFIDIFVTRRLLAMISDIREIEESGLNGSRVRVDRKDDELGELAMSINNMLTTSKQFEEFKVKNKRLESVATFAAGATHELATPLSIVAVASEDMLRDLVNGKTNEEDMYDDIFLIREQVDRCKYIIKQMANSTGAHMGEQIRSFSFDKLLSATLLHFTQETLSQIQVENKIGDKLISMPFQSLCRVLRGLLRNSIDASEEGKPVFLSCYENLSHLIFEVCDKGRGMDENIKKHAADPFFSTKEPGGNLGLGLYLAQSLAGRFNGDLKISSAIGEGTTLSLSFAKEKVYDISK